MHPPRCVRCPMGSRGRPVPYPEGDRFGPGREVLSNVLIRTRIGGPPWSLAEAWGYVEGASSAVPSVCRETAPFRRPCPRRRPGPSRSPYPDAIRTSERGGGTRRQERVPNDDAIPKAVPDAFYGPGRPDACPTLPTGIRTFLRDDPVPVTRSTGPSTDRIAADAPGGRTGPVPEGAIAGRCR